MKNIAIISSVLALLSSGAAHSATFYKDINFGGSTRNAYSPTMDTDIGSFNDQVSSVKVRAGECVLLADHWNFGGEVLILSEGNYATIPSYFNDRATAWSVFKPSSGYSCEESVATFYQNSNRTGWTYPAPNGINNTDINNFNDHASSVKVPAGICVVTYSDLGYKGHSEVLLPGSKYLKSNDSMTSFRTLPISSSECN